MARLAGTAVVPFGETADHDGVVITNGGLGEYHDAEAGCGDGACAPPETCGTCPVDCGACEPCGDGVCDAAESCDTCPFDCGACPGCGDTVCAADES